MTERKSLPLQGISGGYLLSFPNRVLARLRYVRLQRISPNREIVLLTTSHYLTLLIHPSLLWKHVSLTWEHVRLTPLHGLTSLLCLTLQLLLNPLFGLLETGASNRDIRTVYCPCRSHYDLCKPLRYPHGLHDLHDLHDLLE